MQTKIAYLYDPMTGELLSQYEAHESPLEPGVFHAPEASTFKKPPAIQVDAVAVFDAVANKWAVMPDLRGQTFYDQVSGGPLVIDALGAAPSGYAAAKPAMILIAEAQSDQLAALTTAYSAAIQMPVAYMSTTFQADESSQLVLTKALVAGSVPAGFFWMDEGNTQVPMTFAQLKGLAGAMLIQGQAAFVRLQTLKDQVRAAATVADVQAVVW